MLKESFYSSNIIIEYCFSNTYCIHFYAFKLNRFKSKSEAIIICQLIFTEIEM